VAGAAWAGSLAVVNAASYSAWLAPEAIAVAFGSDLASASGAGTVVTIEDGAGVTRSATVFYAYPQQIAFLIPAGTALGSATVSVTSGDGTVSTAAVQISAIAPALFSANANGWGVAAAVAVTGEAYSLVYSCGSAPLSCTASPIALSPATETVLELYGTGIRGHTPPGVTCAIGGVPVPVLYAGAQGQDAGLDQVNVSLPASLAGQGQLDIELMGDGQTANTVTIDTGGSGAIDAGFFGITVGPLSGESAWPVPVPFGTSGKATSGSYWFNIEPSNGGYDWAPLDDIIDSAESAGVTNLMYTFYATPQWASSNPAQSCAAAANWGVYGCAAPPASIADWNNFVTAVVTRYKGRIKYYEPWNEPDVNSEYSGNISEMMTMARSAYQIVKSIDPDAIVLTPSVSIGGVLSADPNCGSSQCWLAQYLAAGGGAYADAIGFHGKACDSTTSICVASEIACPPDAIEQCEGVPLIQQIEDARAIMASNGLAGKPLINTEGGYSTGLASNDLPNASADQQAAFVSRVFIVQASEGLPIAVWFSWLESPRFDFMGFGTAAAEAETNQAYQETHTWLLGSTMHGPCSEGADSVWTCSLTLAGGRSGLIVWSDTATSYLPPGDYTSSTDLRGNTTPVSGPVAIGFMPMLLV
jgi:polysaccharide biosynthesis protein PslG